VGSDTDRSTGFLDRWLPHVVTFVALVMVAFHVMVVWYPMFGELMNQNTHLGFCLVLVFINWAKNAGNKWWKIFNLLCALLSLALVIFMAVNYERLDMNAGWPDPPDVVVGVLLIVVVISSTWRSFGPIFPILVLIAIAYALFGHLIPGVLSHPPFEFGYIVSNLSVGFRGIYGMLLNVSVNMLFLLIVFGAIFDATGITKFFMEFGKLISRHLRGGAGHTATFSSSFVGMVNGVAAANVALTGAYTIPMMKKSGFKPETAVGIEAMASTGGQLTPPIMGIAVFIMAGFLGVSYGDLMFKALIPAVFYYAIAVAGVFLIAFRERIAKGKEIAEKRTMAIGAPVFIIPMGILTALLVLRYSPGYAAFWGIVSLLAVSWISKETRPRFNHLIQCFALGAIMAATFGIACACIGMLVKSMTFTGAATKLSLVITTVSGGNVLPTLVMTMFLSILLASSLPTVIAYIVVAFVAAPILVDLGLTPMVAHFFVFYYAILATVTPPIAGGAIVGSQIAGCKYTPAAMESFKLAAPFFLLPYFMINNPIILSGSQPVLSAVMALAALIIAMSSMICFCQGYCFVVTSKPERLLFLVVSFMATAYGFYMQNALFLGSTALFFVLLIFQWKRRNQRSEI